MTAGRGIILAEGLLLMLALSVARVTSYAHGFDRSTAPPIAEPNYPAIAELDSRGAEMVNSSGSASPTREQEEVQAAQEMLALRFKLRSEKKALIAHNLELSSSEANGFWPLYDEFQNHLSQINRRLNDLVLTYAKDYNEGTLSDEKADHLLGEMLAIGLDRERLRSSYLAKFKAVLPVKKVARFYQIENKIWAIQQFELAGFVPLAPVE